MANESIRENSYTDEMPIKAPVKIGMLSVLLAFSLLGNIFIIVIVLTYRRLKTIFNCLVVNMAVSDLFICIFAIPLKIYDVISPNQWLLHGDLGRASCKIIYFLSDVSPVVSSFSLVIIAVERFVLVVYPMKKDMLFTSKKVCLLIALTWIASAVLLFPHFYFLDLRYTNGTSTCSTPDQPHDYIAYELVRTVIMFDLPLAAITVIYTVMLYHLWRASKKVAGILNDEQMISRQRRNKKIFYMSITIIVAFAVLWGPFFCFVKVFFSGACKSCDPDTLRLFLFLSHFISYSNTAVNPCIYFIFLKSYRKGARNLFNKEYDSAYETELNLIRIRSRTRTTSTSRKMNDQEAKILQ